MISTVAYFARAVRSNEKAGGFPPAFRCRYDDAQREPKRAVSEMPNSRGAVIVMPR